MKRALTLFEMANKILAEVTVSHENLRSIRYVNEVGYMITDGRRLLFIKEEAVPILENKEELLKGDDLKEYAGHKILPVVFVPKSKSIHKRNEVVFNDSYSYAIPPYLKVIPDISVKGWRHMNVSVISNSDKDVIVKNIMGIVGPVKYSYLDILDTGLVLTVSCKQGKVRDPTAVVMTGRDFMYVCMAQWDDSIMDTECPDLNEWKK